MYKIRILGQLSDIYTVERMGPRILLQRPLQLFWPCAPIKTKNSNLFNSSSHHLVFELGQEFGILKICEISPEIFLNLQHAFPNQFITEGSFVIYNYCLNVTRF